MGLKMSGFRRANESEKKLIFGYDDYEKRLGNDMRGRRASMGKSLLDVQVEVGLRPYVILAIENGDLKAFPTPALIGGYVRQYARYLGMDPNVTYKQFCDETGHVGKTSMYSRSGQMAKGSPTTTFGSKNSVDELSSIIHPQVTIFRYIFDNISFVGIGAISLLLFLLAGGGYVTWTLFKQVQQLPVTDNSLGFSGYRPLASNMDIEEMYSTSDWSGSVSVQEPLWLIPNNDQNQLAAIGEINPDMLVTESQTPYEKAVVAKIVDFDVLGMDASIEEGDAEVNFVLMQSVPATPTESENIEFNIQDTIVTSNLVLVPSAPTWVRVRDNNGAVYIERTLATGEEYEIPDVEAELFLRAGNSGYLYFLVDDEVFGPAGSGTRVVKNIPLTPDAIRTTYASRLIESVPLEIQNLSRFSQINFVNDS